MWQRREINGKSKRKTLSFLQSHSCRCRCLMSRTSAEQSQLKRSFSIIFATDKESRQLLLLLVGFVRKVSRVLHATKRNRVRVRLNRRSLDYLRNTEPLPSHSSMFCSSSLCTMLIMSRHRWWNSQWENIDHIDCQRLESLFGSVLLRSSFVFSCDGSHVAMLNQPIA